MALSVLQTMSPRQLCVERDESQFVALHPGRRAGKSEYIPRSALRAVLRAGFAQYVVIGAETKQKAKALHWQKVAALVKTHGLPLTPNVSEGTWTTPWGAHIIFWGFADRGAVDLLRGFEVVAAYFDEVATYEALLIYLVQSVMEPALATTGGRLVLAGTPSLTRAGPWFDICEGNVPGWSVHHWDLRENSFFRNPKFQTALAYLEAVLAKNKWTWDHPVFRREYLGLFVNDLNMMVFRYTRERNRMAGLPPDYDARTWYHTLGIDFGYNPDPCAWVVLASHPHRTDVYAVHAETALNLSQDQAADKTNALIERFHPSRTVGDINGAGKGYVEVYNRRYGAKAGAYVQAAEKNDKRAQIDVLNTELDGQRFWVCEGHADELDADMGTLAWKDDHRLVEKPGMRNHCSDAGIYANREHRSYAFEAPKTSEVPDWLRTYAPDVPTDPDEQRPWWEQAME